MLSDVVVNANVVLHVVTIVVAIANVVFATCLEFWPKTPSVALHPTSESFAFKVNATKTFLELPIF